MHYVYLIKNRLTNKTYIGYSGDLQRRLKERRDKKPELVYYEAYRSLEDAKIRESKLKQRGQSVRRLKERLHFSLTT